MINYEEKYLKYKTKYLELKNSIGGNKSNGRTFEKYGTLEEKKYDMGFPAIPKNNIKNKDDNFIKNYNRYLQILYDYIYPQNFKKSNPSTALVCYKKINEIYCQPPEYRESIYRKFGNTIKFKFVADDNGNIIR